MSIERGKEGVSLEQESLESSRRDSSANTAEDFPEYHEGMTMEQWLADVHAFERQADERRRTEDEEYEARRTEKFRRKAEALRAVQSTGDLVEDFKAYIAASRGPEFDESGLRPELAAAIQSGDQEVLANFFAEGQSLPESSSQNAGVREYQNELRATSQRILEAYRQKHAQATTPEQ